MKNMMTRAEDEETEAQKRLRAGHALEVYGRHFEKEEVVRASCRDYEAAAKVDVHLQEEDMRNWRKVEVPTLVLWSESGLGNRFEVEKIWREWVREDVRMEGMAVGDGVGHYLPEEGPEVVGVRVLEWLKTL